MSITKCQSLKTKHSFFKYSQNVCFFIEEYLQVLHYSHSVHSGQAQPYNKWGTW